MDESLAMLEPYARLLLLYIRTIADREGRLWDRPRSIKAQCLPFDDVDVDALLNTLQDNGRIVRYSYGDAKCIEIVNFLETQKPHPREPESEIPERIKKRSGRGSATAQPRLGRGSAAIRVKVKVEERNLDLEEVDTTPAVIGESPSLPTHCPDLPADFDTFEVRSALQLWASYKSARGEKYKSTHGWSALIKRFQPYGPQALIDAIDTSMSSTWAGLFLPKGGSNGSGRRLSRAELSTEALYQVFSRPDEK